MLSASRFVALDQLRGSGKWQGGAGGGRPRLLVAAEVALGVVLLHGAVLLSRSFVEILRFDPGFAPRTSSPSGVSLAQRSARVAGRADGGRDASSSASLGALTGSRRGRRDQPATARRRAELGDTLRRLRDAHHGAQLAAEDFDADRGWSLRDICRPSARGWCRGASSPRRTTIAVAWWCWSMSSLLVGPGPDAPRSVRRSTSRLGARTAGLPPGWRWSASSLTCATTTRRAKCESRSSCPSTSSGATSSRWPCARPSIRRRSGPACGLRSGPSIPTSRSPTCGRFKRQSRAPPPRRASPRPWWVGSPSSRSCSLPSVSTAWCPTRWRGGCRRSGCGVPWERRRPTW